MSAMIAAEQLVNEGAVHTLSRLLLASTDGAVDDEGCRTSRNRRARVLMSTLLLGEEDDDGFDQHVMDEKKATLLSESRAGPLSRSR